MRKVGTAIAVATMAAVLSGVAVPALAWDCPSKRAAQAVWRATGLDATCGTGMPLPRKGIRIAEAQPRGSRWAAVNFNMSQCSNGVLLYRARLGSSHWTYAGSFGSDFVAPGSCSNVAGMPPRIIPDLTGMTCRGRETPRVLRHDRWF